MIFCISVVILTILLIVLSLRWFSYISQAADTWPFGVLLSAGVIICGSILTNLVNQNLVAATKFATFWSGYAIITLIYLLIFRLAKQLLFFSRCLLAIRIHADGFFIWNFAYAVAYAFTYATYLRAYLRTQVRWYVPGTYQNTLMCGALWCLHFACPPQFQRRRSRNDKSGVDKLFCICYT